MNRRLSLPLRRLLCALLFALTSLAAMSTTSSSPTPARPMPLASGVFNWDSLPAKPTPVGVRREVFEGPTTTLDQLHCHITTLNPGEKSGEPRLHLQEEVIIVKEGTVEAHFDGKTQVAQAGGVIYFAARATTSLRNIGTTPATYIVIYYHTPLTPKS